MAHSNPVWRVNPGGPKHNEDDTSAEGGAAGGTYSSLEACCAALKEHIRAGADNLVPECTFMQLSLDCLAQIPLCRPNIGPYADGGAQDLPEEFKPSWTDISHTAYNGTQSVSVPTPQATVDSIVENDDPRVLQIVQRAASRGIVAAIEAADGFKYCFNNTWRAKEDNGQRYSYICQDSVQNKDRHANDCARTRKHLRGAGARGLKKPTYDCKGTVIVKYSSTRRCVDVYYKHHAVHATVVDRELGFRQRQTHSWMVEANALVPGHATDETGGLFGMLTTTNPVHAPERSSSDATGGAQPLSQSLPNVGRPRKRKREMGEPARPSVEPLSLVELLRQSESTKPFATSLTAPPTRATHNPAPMAYELPSWQEPYPTSPHQAPFQPRPIPPNPYAGPPNRQSSGKGQPRKPPPYPAQTSIKPGQPRPGSNPRQDFIALLG